jgi:predicted enzyme related to lactoylglutathione lyase
MRATAYSSLLLAGTHDGLRKALLCLRQLVGAGDCVAECPEVENRDSGGKMKFDRVMSLLVAALLFLAVLAACSTPSVGRWAELPLSEEPLTGKFVWHDLITDDVDQAKRFYGRLMGWSFEDTKHPNGGDYTLILSGERFVAGIVHLVDPAGVEYSRWLGYLSVAAVDEAVRFNESQGGDSVVGPLELPGIGRAAAIKDPQEAVVGLIRSDHGDPDDSLQPGAGLVVWNELLAADEAAAAEFYARLTGLDVIEQQRANGIYRVLASAEHKRAGVAPRPSEDTEPLWLTHFGVKDVAASTALVAELGGQVLLAPDPAFRNGLQAVVVDPAGAVLTLHQWTQ